MIRLPPWLGRVRTKRIGTTASIEPGEVVEIASSAAAERPGARREPSRPEDLRKIWLVGSSSARTQAFLVVLAGEAHNPGPEGLAHYAEHLVCAAANEGAEPGATLSNAWTDHLSTVYHAEASANQLDAMLECLARVLTPIALEERFMVSEFAIVSAERTLGLRRSLDIDVHEELAHRLHVAQWPARSIIGTQRSLAALSPGDMRTWHARTHVAGNAVLMLCSDLSPERLGASVRWAFARCRATDAGADIGDSACLGGAGLHTPCIPDYQVLPAQRRRHRYFEPRVAAPRVVHARVARLNRHRAPGVLGAQLELLHALLVSAQPDSLIVRLEARGIVARELGIELVDLGTRHIELRVSARPEFGVEPAALADALEACLDEYVRRAVAGTSHVVVRRALLDRHDRTLHPHEAVLAGGLRALARGSAPDSFPQRRRVLAALALADLNALLGSLARAPRTTTLLLCPSRDS